MPLVIAMGFVGGMAGLGWVFLLTFFWAAVCCTIEPERSQCFILTWAIVWGLYKLGWLTIFTGCGV